MSGTLSKPLGWILGGGTYRILDEYSIPSEREGFVKAIFEASK